MRNFYVKGKVDGRKTPITAGPRNKHGGMVVTLHQKEKGESVKILSVSSSVLKDGKLRTIIHVKGVEPKIIITEP